MNFLEIARDSSGVWELHLTEYIEKGSLTNIPRDKVGCYYSLRMSHKYSQVIACIYVADAYIAYQSEKKHLKFFKLVPDIILGMED